MNNSKHIVWMYIFLVFILSQKHVFCMEQEHDSDENKRKKEKLITEQRQKLLKKHASSPSLNGDPFKYIQENNYEKLKGLAVLDPSLRKFNKDGESTSLLLAAIINVKKQRKKQSTVARAILGLMLKCPNINEQILNEALDYAKIQVNLSKDEKTKATMNDVVFALNSVISLSAMKKTAEKKIKEFKEDPKSFDDYKKLIQAEQNVDNNNNENVPRKRSESVVKKMKEETNKDKEKFFKFLQDGPPIAQQKKEKKNIKKREKQDQIVLNQAEHRKNIFDRLRLPWGNSNEKKLEMITKQLQNQKITSTLKHENAPPPANSIISSSSFSNSNPNLTIGLSHSADESPKSSSLEKYYGQPGIKQPKKKFDPDNNNNNQ
ncbi:MAG: hypothetical protein BWY54_00066 [Candidatus Dependentiae bacterium ADurb.Bin331]|nr:MAG: hypothetical protein BWY54_00066 [Candidatus Dependentiae bacterium ADurb.Bin331]